VSISVIMLIVSVLDQRKDTKFDHSGTAWVTSKKD